MKIAIVLWSRIATDRSLAAADYVYGGANLKVSTRRLLRRNSEWRQKPQNEKGTTQGDLRRGIQVQRLLLSRLAAAVKRQARQEARVSCDT